MAKKQTPTEEEPRLCDNCGNLKVEDEEGNWYCPSCDTEIDWGLDEEDEK